MSDILVALGNVFTIGNLAGLIFGTGAGILIGAMPGLSVNMGIALLFPLTFAFQGVGGILMLLGIYCGAIYGGSISAILLKTPGTPASVATTLDGYPMATKLKQPGRALGLSTFGSTFGGIFSAICLIIFSPMLASVALKFSKPEYFALAVFGLSIITSVSSGSILKGLLGGFIGLFIATIGIDNLSGSVRFAFGSTYLLGGISFVPILIGLFAFSQVLQSVEDCYKEKYVKTDVKLTRVFPTWEDLKRVFVTLLRSSIIGTFIGCVPGTGGDIASFVSYDQAKRWSKYKDNFGNGEPEGIVAPEAGNNSVSGGAMIPMLTLGVPGDAVAAIMIGALTIQGLTPGPMLFKTNKVLVYTIFLGMFVANTIMVLLGFSCIRLFTKVLSVPKTILTPIIFILCVVGSYAMRSNFYDVGTMLIAGVIGWLMGKVKIPTSPAILGLILGPMAEKNFRTALLKSSGNPVVFFNTPICWFFLALIAFTLFGAIRGQLKKKTN